METSTDVSNGSFLDDILKPGSSLHPQFLIIIDVAFVALFLVLSGLAVVTRGNIHIFGLMCVELGLWASVKWFVYELKKTPQSETTQAQGKERKDI